MGLRMREQIRRREVWGWLCVLEALHRALHFALYFALYRALYFGASRRCEVLNEIRFSLWRRVAPRWTRSVQPATIAELPAFSLHFRPRTQS
jgi:hypothetical protein